MRLFPFLYFFAIFLQFCNQNSKKEAVYAKNKLKKILDLSPTFDSSQVTQTKESYLPITRSRDTSIFFGNKEKKIQVICYRGSMHAKHIIIDCTTKDTLLSTKPNDIFLEHHYGGEALTLKKDTLKLDFYLIPNIPMHQPDNYDKRGTYIGNICIFFDFVGKMTSKVEMYDFSKVYKYDINSIKERYKSYIPRPSKKMGNEKTWNNYITLIDDILLCALAGNEECKEMLAFREHDADGAVSEIQGFASQSFGLYQFYKKLSLKVVR